MRWVVLFALAMIFAGCKSGRKVVKENRAVEFTDTGKVVTDSVVTKITKEGTDRLEAAQKKKGCIEFVEGGGTVIIDTTGNVTLQGVKSISGKEKTRLNESNKLTEHQEATKVREEKQSGITNRENYEKHEERGEKVKWYDTVFARVGQLCCIAVLLYMLFLYLKQKK